MTIVLLGEAMGENEAKIGKGFVGASGVELLKMLHESGLLELTSDDYDFLNKYWNNSDPNMIDCVWNLHPEFHRTNVFQRRPQGNKIEAFCGGKKEGIPGYPALIKGKFVLAEYEAELDRLGDELVQHNPNLIIAFGNTALWALAGKTAISKQRGTTCLSTHTVTGFKLLPTYHPAAVLRQWELRPTTVADLMKAKRESAFPEIRRPKREIWIEPTIGDIDDFISRYMHKGCLVAVDIETAGNQITCIGFAPNRQVAIVIPFVDSRQPGRSYWPNAITERAAWDRVGDLLGRTDIRKSFQNGLYDIAFLIRSMGLKTFGATEDTMLLHHALQPESLKSLGFLGSVYTDEASWKGMRKTETIKADE